MQIQEAVRQMENDDDLQNKMREDPVATLKTMSAMPLQTDVWIYRGVVGALGSTVMLTVVGAVLLSFYERTIPEGVFVMAGTCAGAMAVLITPSQNKG